jgi:hypothetical protein
MHTAFTMTRSYIGLCEARWQALVRTKSVYRISSCCQKQNSLLLCYGITVPYTYTVISSDVEW